jgi:hypothetical protein
LLFPRGVSAALGGSLVDAVAVSVERVDPGRKALGGDTVDGRLSAVVRSSVRLWIVRDGM